MRSRWRLLSVVMATVGVMVIANPTGAAGVDVDTFHGIDPERLLDTRAAPTVDGQFSGIGSIAAGTTVELQVAGRAGIPTHAVEAVGLNITATGATADGYLTVWPTGAERPTASNLNFAAGTTVPNLTVVEIGSNGRASIYNGGSSAVDVIVDAAGWFPVGGTFDALTPARLVDTRQGTSTIDGVDAGRGTLGGRQGLGFKVAGRAGVPSSGAGSVALNVTVTEPTEAGFFSVSPQANNFVGASTLNFARGQTVAALAIVPINQLGEVWISNGSFGPVEAIVDVLGWFPDGSSSTGLTPFRLMDTRAGALTEDRLNAGGGPVSEGRTVNLRISGRGIPEGGVGSVALNVTVVSPSRSGFLTVSPQGSGRGRSSERTTSNLNFAAGQTVANAVLVPLGGDGQISIRLTDGHPNDELDTTADVLVDVLGWFPNATQPPTSAGNDLVLRPDGIGTAELGTPALAAVAEVETIMGQRLTTTFHRFLSTTPSGVFIDEATGSTFVYRYSQRDCFIDGFCLTSGGDTPDAVAFVGWEYAGPGDGRLIDENGLTAGSRLSDFPFATAAIHEGGCDSRGEGEATSGVHLGLFSTGAPFATGTPPLTDLVVTGMWAGELVGSTFSDC